ncbi:MAG: hypothetical protein MJ184_10970 [Treponema sp.]|uniref:hypothetical protein n=1 Tax=Treponema sp. TaxID=166 RepID=UPI00298E02F6|nr:hypothetical protein [Treponema sp.]MCQ2601869.1 hypothetical protein [Treponema sp.]
MNDLVLYSSAFGGSYEKYMTQVSTQTVTAIAADEINKNISAASLQIQRGLVVNTKAAIANARATVQLGKTMIASAEMLNITMENGFASISNELGAMRASFSVGLSGISDAINRMSEKICSKLDEIHDIVNNPLLTASRELYRRAATNYQKKFYEEALEDILGAVEKNKTDYISWYLAGQLYLFGVSEFSNVINVVKAEEAFMNVTKYISVDVGNSEEAKKLAAEAYFYLAYSRYILSNENRLENKKEECNKYLESAIQAGTKAFSFSNEMIEALYNNARCYVLLEKKEEALKMIENCIKADAYYVLRFLAEDEFKNIYDDILNLIEKLRQELIVITKNHLDYIKDIPNKYTFYEGKFSKLVKDKITELSAFVVCDDIEYLDLRKKSDEIYKFVDFFEKEDFPTERLVCKQDLRGEDLCFSASDIYKKNYENTLLIQKSLFLSINKIYDYTGFICNVINEDIHNTSKFIGYRYEYASLRKKGYLSAVLFPDINPGASFDVIWRYDIEDDTGEYSIADNLMIEDRSFVSETGAYKIIPKVVYENALDGDGRSYHKIQKVSGLNILSNLFEDEVLILENEIKELGDLYPVFTDSNTLMVYRVDSKYGSSKECTLCVFQPSIVKELRSKEEIYNDDLVIVKLFKKFMEDVVDLHLNKCTEGSESFIQDPVIAYSSDSQFFICDADSRGIHYNGLSDDSKITQEDKNVISRYDLFEKGTRCGECCSGIDYIKLKKYLRYTYDSNSEIIRILNEAEEIQKAGITAAREKWAQIAEEQRKAAEKKAKTKKRIKVLIILAIVLFIIVKCVI